MGEGIKGGSDDGEIGGKFDGEEIWDGTLGNAILFSGRPETCGNTILSHWRPGIRGTALEKV